MGPMVMRLKHNEPVPEWWKHAIIRMPQTKEEKLEEEVAFLRGVIDQLLATKPSS